MKAKVQEHIHPYSDPEAGSRSMVLYFGLSLLFHVVFLGSMLVMPEPGPGRTFSAGAINVSLVSLPGPPAPGPVSQPAAKSVDSPKEEVKAIAQIPEIATPPPQPLAPAEKPEKTVSLAPPKEKKKAKESLKEKTQDRQKMIDQALSKVQKNVEKPKTDSVQQAIDRLKQKVAETEAKGGSGGAVGVAGATGGGAMGVPGGSGGGGQRELELIDIYRIEVAFQVERNWAYSPQLAGSGRTAQASVVFKVLPNGEITDISFTQESGNSYLDDSAYKAIMKANPVSPHPPELKRPYVVVALRFTPEGVR
jgi:colicin import membrane protein